MVDKQIKKVNQKLFYLTTINFSKFSLTNKIAPFIKKLTSVVSH